ncbi:MAG: prepilin peptidase [Deltaproteobacteria bacterium]|jgi:leader peptidase (prepilin peptidase)/N-methyltransferase|nr:prepilin peptidase [Deltaproteobacteria bacterium]
MNFNGALGTILEIGIFFLGLSVGSFLNVVIYRLPREGLSIWRPSRSFCPNCQNQLRWHDNIPVLGYILLKGRCRYCQSPISVRYPLVELLSGILALSLYLRYGLSVEFLFYWYFVSALTAIAFIDSELMLIPDVLVIPTCFLGVALALIVPNPDLTGELLWNKLLSAGWNRRLISLLGSILGLRLGFLSLYLSSKAYKLWRGRDGLGAGDPPLLGMIGIFLGWRSIFPILFLSSVIGLLSVILTLFSGKLPTSRKGREGLSAMRIPFGPFLVLSALFWLFYGERIIRWYLSLLVVKP